MPGHASAELARRLRQVRVELYGESGGARLAALVDIPDRTWANFEAGVIIPGAVALRFVVLTGVHPVWLLTGDGPRRSPLEPSEPSGHDGDGTMARHADRGDGDGRLVVATPSESS